MDAADPLRAARPEEGPEKPKSGESQDDGYETSNSGEARRVDPEPPPPDNQPPLPPPQPPQHEYEVQQLMRPIQNQNYQNYRQFEQPEEYQHFPFPKYSNDPYSFKRDADAPYDMSQHHHHQNQLHQQYPKRDDDMYNGVKRECEDPYSFVEEEAMSMMLNAQHSGHHQPPHEHAHLMHQQMMLNQPKKRGRKKKIKDENGMEIKAEGMEGVIARPVKERKKHDRFNGMSEEEVARRTLPDHLAENLDIIIIGINPGLFAAYKGHHYAGPGNHFWKCLYLSGLTREQMSADEDYKLLNFGIGFTNMVPRPTKGSADLTRREIKEGSAVLLEKLQTYRPKVAVFNGKLIYEVFSGKKDFCFGKQPDTIAGTNTYMWVMPSSSARCAQLPRAADKVPFYAALKKFRDFLNGLVPHVDDSELVFPDTTARRPHEEMEIRRSTMPLTMEPEPGDTIILEDGTEVPLKKKRGRPKKVKLENGEVVPPTPRAPRAPRPPPALGPNGEEPPKKKRGRPKKIRPEEQQFLLQQQQQQQAQQQQQQAQQQQPQPQPPEHQPQPQQQQQQSTPMLGGLPMSGISHEQQYPAPMPFCEQQMYLQQQQHDPYYQHSNAASSPMEPSQAMDMGMSLSGQGGYASPRAYHSPRQFSPGPRHQQPQFPGSPASASNNSTPTYGGRLANPVARSGGGYGTGSPYAHSPQYSRSPAPCRPYSRSPAPAGSTPTGAFGAASPGGALHSYTPSPQHTPYSQHSSPAPLAAQLDQHYSQAGSAGSASGSVGSGGTSYAAELSADIGAAISSPPAPSPPLAVDFEPPAAPPAPPPTAPSSTSPMHHSNSNSSLSDYNKAGSVPGEMSPGVGGVQFPSGGSLAGYEGERMSYHMHSPHNIDKDTHYKQEQGSSGVDSPRLDQMHQHAMYPTNYNRSTPDGVGVEGQSFRPPEQSHTPHHPGSPASYGETKPKSQDVASKSLSGLESLVDQIPSIAEGPAGVGGGVVGAGPGGVGAVGVASSEQAPPTPVSSLPEYAPALYGPYSAYGQAYGNNGYGAAPFVGYAAGGWGGVMRPTPGYLSDWQYGYGAPVAGSYPPYNAPYYTPPPAHHPQAHYLSAPPLLELHKNGEQGAVPAVPSVPSVGFGGFC